MAAWLATNRSFEMAASTEMVSGLDSTVEEGSSQALCAWAAPSVAARVAARAMERSERFMSVFR